MPLAAFARTRELLDMDFPGRPAFWQSGYSLIPDFARRANIFSDTSLALALPGNPNTAVSFGIGMDRNGSRWSPHHSDPSDLLRSAKYSDVRSPSQLADLAA
jgi:hypothetical protein